MFFLFIPALKNDIKFEYSLMLYYPFDGQNDETNEKTDKRLYKLHTIPIVEKRSNMMTQNRLEANYALKENNGAVVTVFEVLSVFQFCKIIKTFRLVRSRKILRYVI